MSGPSQLSNSLVLKDLGERLRSERTKRQWSLDDLASASGVSPSLLADLERGDNAPSVLILERIARSLGTSLPKLLEGGHSDKVVLLRKEHQEVAHGAAGWERRILSPVLPGVEFEFLRTTVNPGVDAGTFSPHAPGSREYVAVEKGTLVVTLDGQTYTLVAGDSIYYAGDCVHSFRNTGRQACTYYLAMDVGTHPRGTKHGPPGRLKR